MADTIQRGSKRNFTMFDNALFDEWDYFDLDTYDIVVYFCLLRYADNNTRQAFPGYPHIAKVTRMSERRVATSIKHLSEQGLIDVKQRYDKTGGQTSNLYTVYDANEVINRGSTTCKGGMHHVQGGVAPRASGGWHHVHAINTHLKILKEKEGLCTDEENKKNLQALKEIVLNDIGSGGGYHS
jgi:predicted transcriptional regulator